MRGRVHACIDTLALLALLLAGYGFLSGMHRVLSEHPVASATLGLPWPFLPTSLSGTGTSALARPSENAHHGGSSSSSGGSSSSSGSSGSGSVPAKGKISPTPGRGSQTKLASGGTAVPSIRSSAHTSTSSSGWPGRQVVVMYIFSATNAEFFDNLRFFVAEAVQGDTRCDYVLVVQGYQPGQEAVSGGVVGL